MKYVAVLLLGMLLGAVLHRGWSLRQLPVTPVVCAEACPTVAAVNAPMAAPAPAETPPAPVAADTTAAPASSGLPSLPVDPAQPGLLIPVQGKVAADLTDTFADSRRVGEPHEAIDIMAAEGTPVLAVADGHVEKLFDSRLGGVTLYQFEPTGQYAYYYAHLQRYADGIAEKQAIRRGQVIGHVGSTGNADPAAPHLHFAVFRLGPERRWWQGTAINPYPLLVNAQVAAR